MSTVAPQLKFHSNFQFQCQFSEWRKSDHLERSLSGLGLTPYQIEQIAVIFDDPVLKTDDVIKMAERSNFTISPHLVYRYLNSIEFADNYHGSRCSHHAHQMKPQPFYDQYNHKSNK